MDFDNSFYEWKSQKVNNRQLFAEKSNDLPKCNKIFSSTTVEDQTETETFSLRLSESYEVDETQQSFEKNKHAKIEEIILISDSSCEEESLSIENPGTRGNYANPPCKDIQKNVCIVESSDDEFPNSQVKEILPKSTQEVSSVKKLNEKPSRRKVIIEESDSELEEDKLPEIIKETIAESATLSDRKKKEILQWLSTNIDGSRCGSSCSTESAIAGSRKSGISSGNSSLERLELNFETPNNRGKISKSGTVRQKNCSNESENQMRIDQYFSNKKNGHLQINKDFTPKSKIPNKIPAINLKNVILSDKKSCNNEIPRSKFSDSTPVNSVHNKNNILLGHRSVLKTPVVIRSSDKNINSAKNKSNKISITSDSSKSDHSDALTEKSMKLNSRNIIIPETQSFESDNEENIKENPNTKNCKDTKVKLLSDKNATESDDNLLKTSDEDIFRSSADTNSKSNDLQISDQNNTIDDCADILENLYGSTWRDKLNTRVAVTEPRKKPTKTDTKKLQTEKKIDGKKSIFKGISGKKISDKENRITEAKTIQTDKINRTHRYKDSFIHDSESSECSPDCSYYTALTNPVPSQNNIPKTLPIARNRDNDNLKKIMDLCDSDSDDENWKKKDFNQRKLSFDSSTSSSTSEFDPEDIVLPKISKTKNPVDIVIPKISKTKNPVDIVIPKISKTKKPMNVQSVKQKISNNENQSIKKSFLASLSKDVPLENADFKAMVYRVKYNSLKEELCKVLYNLFNEKVFDNKLPEDMSIEWSVRLRGTAGKCYNKQSIKALGNTIRSSRIVLATKVLDSPDRVRDTLIHEMCHAATWLINNISDGHGRFWKAWASKAMKAFPELPTISRCHNYEIQTKYTYKCTSCGYSIGRHSKSLDLNRKRCGYCHGTFELLINRVTKAGKVQKKSTAQKKEPSGFALFVKENYHVVKQSGTTMKHGEVMKMLGQQFSAVKITPKPTDRIRNNDDESP